MFLSWISLIIPMRSMSPKPYWQGQAAADACAAGECCQIGGFIHHASGKSLWFSEVFTCRFRSSSLEVGSADAT